MIGRETAIILAAIGVRLMCSSDFTMKTAGAGYKITCTAHSINTKVKTLTGGYAGRQKPMKGEYHEKRKDCQ